MPLIEYIVPRSEKRIVLVCAFDDRVSTVARKLHEINPDSFGLYICRGGDPLQDLLLHTVRRQYAYVIQLDVTREVGYSVYVETSDPAVPFIQSLVGKPAICIRKSSSLYTQINVSEANLDLTCVWLAPLLHDGATRL